MHMHAHPGCSDRSVTLWNDHESNGNTCHNIYEKIVFNLHTQPYDEGVCGNKCPSAYVHNAPMRAHNLST